MSFKPYHYDNIPELIRYYALELESLDIIRILDSGIKSEEDAKAFCDFIPMLLDKRLADEKSGKEMSLDIGSSVIAELHYEAGSFVCDAGFEKIWDEMIEQL